MSPCPTSLNQSNMVLPARPLRVLSRLRKNCLRHLKKTGLSRIQDAEVRLFLDDVQLNQVNLNRTGPCSLNDDGNVLLLCWPVDDPCFRDLLKIAKSWKRAGGGVRNQRGHNLCWAYASTDLVSTLRVIRELDGEYAALCVWYLCAKVHPEKLGTRHPVVENHICYGSKAVDALAHMVNVGVPRKVRTVFDCREQPPSAETHLFQIDSYLEFDTLSEALAQLQHQPIGATLLVCPRLWHPDMKKDIYYGPNSEGSVVTGYHAVMVVALDLYRGELVAICKLSNGRKVGDEGYVRVSLCVKYMVLGVDGQRKTKIRATPTPQYLLTRFCCPVIPQV